MSDLRKERPVRVSGAFDIDMSKVVEEAARRAAEAVASQVAPALSQYAQGLLEALMPALAKINQTVENTAGLMFPAGLMNQDDARATLCSMLPAGFLSGAATADQVADFQLQRLTEAGYAVVPVAGAALEHAIRVAQHRQHLAESGPYPPGSVEALQHAAGVDVEAVRRADERLAQATRDPEDYWREDQ